MGARVVAGGVAGIAAQVGGAEIRVEGRGVGPGRFQNRPGVVSQGSGPQGLAQVCAHAHWAHGANGFPLGSVPALGVERLGLPGSPTSSACPDPPLNSGPGGVRFLRRILSVTLTIGRAWWGQGFGLRVTWEVGTVLSFGCLRRGEG